MSQAHSLNQVLSLKQTTILAPQLQQGVRLLQLSSTELQNQIDIALETNPFLEKLDVAADLATLLEPSAASGAVTKSLKPNQSFHAAQIRGSVAGPSVSGQLKVGTGSSQRSQDSSDWNVDSIADLAGHQTLHGFLRQQANATPLNARQHFILELLIGSVNDRGYLRAGVDEIVQLAMPEYVLTRTQVEEAISTLQDFEPEGVGARSARECLLLQLRDRPVDTPGLELAAQIIKRHLVALAKKQYQQIMTDLEASEADVQGAIKLIRQLNPFPGLSIAPEYEQLIVPDLIVRKGGDRWMVRLNPNVAPAISIHQESADLLKLAKGQSGYDKLKQTLQDARVLLSNIEKRYQTILRVATLIVDRQEGFLEQGEAALKPLRQKEIADVLDIHVSTVSRAVNDKYILTPAGVVELSSFFCTAIQRSDGESISSRAIQVQIRALIDEEAKAKPLSDAKITEILCARGIQLARRTVMKYREQLSIPASPQRRLR